MLTSTSRTASFRQLGIDRHFSERDTSCRHGNNASKLFLTRRIRDWTASLNRHAIEVLARIIGAIARTKKIYPVIVSTTSVVSTSTMWFLSAQNRWFVLSAMLVCMNSANAQQAFPQVYAPGTFFLDGFPVNCGYTVTIVTPLLPDIAMAQPGRILLHPMLSNYPTGVKLFVYTHECAHQFVGANEPAADAWAIKLGPEPRMDQSTHPQSDLPVGPGSRRATGHISQGLNGVR